MKKIIPFIILFQLIASNNLIAAPDTLQYRYHTLKKSGKTIISTEKDTVISTFEISYPEFTDPELNSFVQYLIIGGSTEFANINSYVQLADAFLKEADDINTEELDFPRAWFRNIDLKVQKQITGTQTLSFSLYDESYTGGAHPLGNLFFINYDLKNQNRIKITDLIKDIMLARLNYIGETIFRKQEGLSTSQTLDNYFFEGGQFKLTNNFLINEKGLVFWYNPYEVRSYAEGPLELIIPYSEINSLIIPDNPYTPKLNP